MFPLGSIICKYGLGYHCYADDTQLYVSTMNNIHKATLLLASCLQGIKTWMQLSFLQLNSLLEASRSSPQPRFATWECTLTASSHLRLTSSRSLKSPFSIWGILLGFTATSHNLPQSASSTLSYPPAWTTATPFLWDQRTRRSTGCSTSKTVLLGSLPTHLPCALQTTLAPHPPTH